MATDAICKGDATSTTPSSSPVPPLRSVSTPSLNHHRLDELFKTCDTKGLGVIGPDEFRDLCNKFGISPADSDVIFIDLDHDGDGFIDFDDFSHGFRDFLTPGSRRGSLQIGCVAETNGSSSQQLQLEMMEKRHASARTAWKHFVHNVGPNNLQPFISTSKEQLYEIVEEIHQQDKEGKQLSSTLEKALTGLIMDVQHLHEEYKTLENSFRKEREVHAAQLVALGEELDQQLAKAEAKAKAEAREEAQRQMDAERKKIATEIESQLSDLSSQIRTFQKVEEWLAEEESRDKRGKTPQDQTKLHEAENENRNLKSALVEAQMKATLLQTQLTQKRNEYLDLFNALHSEKLAASEYKSQVDLMQNHLVVLSEANRVLSDANDCLTTKTPIVPGQRSNSSCSSAQQDTGSIQANSNSCPNSLVGIDTTSDVSSFGSVKQSKSDPRFTCVTTSPFHEIDRDSGRSTLLEELRAEGDGSPLPSGIWTCSPSSSSAVCTSALQQPPDLAMDRSKCATQIGNGIGRIGSSCCTTDTGRRDEKSAYSSDSTYRSFDFAEELYPTPHPPGTCKQPVTPLNEKENEKCLDPVAHTASPFYPCRTFKVILAGDAAVGKTTFIERICYGHFTPNLSSTIGVDFRVKTIEIEGKFVALQLWDTAGQERFRSLTKSYFRRADGVILMYDVSNERTFANIRNWIHNVEEGAGRRVPIVLSGNKVDLRDDKCQRPASFVSQSEGAKLASQCGAIFMETSPKTGHNVFETLMMLAMEMSQIEDAELRNSLQLSERLSEDKLKKKGCCSSGQTGTQNGTADAKGAPAQNYDY